MTAESRMERWESMSREDRGQESEYPCTFAGATLRDTDSRTAARDAEIWLSSGRDPAVAALPIRPPAGGGSRKESRRRSQRDERGTWQEIREMRSNRPVLVLQGARPQVPRQSRNLPRSGEMRIRPQGLLLPRRVLRRLVVRPQVPRRQRTHPTRGEMRTIPRIPGLPRQVIRRPEVWPQVPREPKSRLRKETTPEMTPQTICLDQTAREKEQH